ncbi:hypothetical protein CBS147326_8406 [Penicillium roqueforti]|nr:hypothetical protein CBS147326_8406 [Penicillium roqueforti]
MPALSKSHRKLAQNLALLPLIVTQTVSCTLHFDMPGVLQQYLKQCWKATLGITLYCQKLFCCTSTEFAELTSLNEMDSVGRHPVKRDPDEFDEKYHDYQFDEAQVHYTDTENPKIELIFRKGEEKAKIVCSLKNLRIVSTGLGYRDELGVPMVELEVEFYHWTIPVDVPRVSLKGHKGFRPSKILS